MGGEELHKVEWDEDTATTTDGYGSVSGEADDDDGGTFVALRHCSSSGPKCSQRAVPKIEIMSVEIEGNITTYDLSHRCSSRFLLHARQTPPGSPKTPPHLQNWDKVKFRGEKRWNLRE